MAMGKGRDAERKKKGEMAVAKEKKEKPEKGGGGLYEPKCVTTVQGPAPTPSPIQNPRCMTLPLSGRIRCLMKEKGGGKVPRLKIPNTA